MNENDVSPPEREGRDQDNPEYTPPVIKTYTSEEILEEIGPAQACSPDPCAIAP